MKTDLATLCTTSALACALSLSNVGGALANGGDFVGGMIAGGIIGTIVGSQMNNPPPRHVYRAPRVVVVDPAVTEYWRNVQQALDEVGINVGRPDGVPGGRTRAGVRSFQMSLGNEPTGTLTQPQYTELMRQAGVGVAMGGGPVDTPPAYVFAPTMQPQVTPIAPVMTMQPQQQGVVPVAVAPQPATVPVTNFAPAAAAEAAPAVAPAAQQVAAVEAPKASAADKAMLDSLITPAKALGDADIDGISKQSSVLGVHLGDGGDAAAQAFANGVGNCQTSGSLTECAGKTDAFTDKASFATVGAGADRKVYFLARDIEFAKPVPKEAIIGKLGETIKAIVEAPNMVLSTSAACDRSAATDLDARESAIGTFARSPVTGAVGVTQLLATCGAYFTAVIPEKDGLATGLRVSLFDGRALPRDSATPAASAAPATVPGNLKF